MKNFCKDLKEHVMNITNFERLKILPLTGNESKHYRKQKLNLIVIKSLENSRSLSSHWKI